MTAVSDLGPAAGAFGALLAPAQRAIDAGRLRPELTDASLAAVKPNLPGPPLDLRGQTMTNALLAGIKRAS